jgi:hypothetical protein
MKAILMVICIFSLASACKPGKGVAKTSYYTDSLKMEQAIKITMKKMHL